MASESEFVTAPTTPEPDSLEIVVQKRLLLHDDDGEGGSRSMTIFRVPARVRDANKELYEPRLLSVGPYYRGRAALRAMEQHKWRYLRELQREQEHRPRISPANFVEAVRDVEHRARCCYAERTDIFDDDGQSRPGPAADEFGEMLLLDGCFILQFFIKWHNKEEDDICDVGWGIPLLHSDLLLLENQIPFFVLEELFQLVAGPEADTSHVRSLILPHLRVLSDKQLSPTETERATGAGEIRHLLHLLYEAVVPTAEEMAALVAVDGDIDASPPRLCSDQLRQMGIRVKKAVSERFALMRGMAAPQLPRWMAAAVSWFSKCRGRIGRRAAPDTETTTTRTAVVPPVTLLRKAGVRFEKKATARHMLDIEFDAAASVVRMPRLEVDHASMPLLVNLVAFEQTVRDDGGGRRRRHKPVSCYAALVGSLVRTGEDVEHLQKRGIVDNLLGTDDDAAAKFFQHLGDCASVDYGEDHIFAAMFADLNRYYRSSWRRHKAEFLRDHCSSPWAVLALVVAGCAFCFALFKLSTTIYGFAHPYCHC